MVRRFFPARSAAQVPVVLWFGQADRPWSQQALEALWPWAQVHRLPPQFTAEALPETQWPPVADLLVLEEHRPGQLDSACIERLVRRYPLAGLVVLEGPWSAASYAPAWRTDPHLPRVPWHDWPWLLRGLQQWGRTFPASWLVPLVGTGEGFSHYGPCQEPSRNTGDEPPEDRASLANWHYWLLVADAGLRHLLAEVLAGSPGTLRQWPLPPKPEELRILARGEPAPQVVLWQLGNWFPGHPWRELELLDRLAGPERIVALGVQDHAELLAAARPLRAQVTWVPLPFPEDAFPAFCQVEAAC